MHAAPACLVTSLSMVTLATALCGQEPYREPPSDIVRAVTAAPAPSVSLSPDARHLLLSTRENMVSIAVQARPILRLAGRRIDPGSHGPQRGRRTTGMSLINIATGRTERIDLPEGVDLGRPVWTADGRRFAFTNTTDTGIELWLCRIEGGRGAARRIDGVSLVATSGTPVQWMPNQRTLLCRTLAKLGPAPIRPRTPLGPIIQESSGHKSPVRTFQDLLQDQHDATLFEYHMTSQLAVVDPDSGKLERIGKPGIYSGVRVSPDGEYLLVTRTHRPFSFLVTSRSFPKETSIWNRAGQKLQTVVDQPLADKTPIGGVITGRRSVTWMPTENATLYWAEALDGGDPRREVEHRDKIMVQTAPFRSTPVEWTRTAERFSRVSFVEKGDVAILSEYSRKLRMRWAWRVSPKTLSSKPTLLYKLSTQDAYGDPGRPLTKRSHRGRSVMRQLGHHVFLRGLGASDDGNRPFLDIWNMENGEKMRLFRCRPKVYESVVGLLAADASRLLIRHESPTEFPNYYELDCASGKRRALTHFTDPIADLTKKIVGKLIHYKRADGIPMSGTLYMPIDHKEGQKHPALVWAYPREYRSRRDAGQVRGTPYRYTRLAGTSPLLMTLAGYVVFNGATMPIVGPTRTANDTFVSQLVANGDAACDKLISLGVVDKDRIAIAGHSYGAFMTVNLLARSDRFRAGIARSGAYNRTLTPFGFQNERRTYWEAPDIYFAMSPFMHAPKIDEPLLLIHGVMDNNSGTFPIQSQRLFHAVKGHGGTVRLVMLPFESHSYRARESVLHCLAEQVDWLDRYVKNAPPRQPKFIEAATEKSDPIPAKRKD